MYRLSPLLQRRILTLLVEGMSIRAITRATGASRGAVDRLITDAGTASAAYHDTHVRQIRARYVECDEIWSYIYAKEKRVKAGTLTGSPAYAGDAWTWTALDAETKLIIAYLLAPRSAEAAHTFMHDLAARVIGRIQLSTDAYHAYREAVMAAFIFCNRPIDYAQTIKSHSGTRAHPHVELTPMLGRPDAAHISTSLVERQNLTMRTSMRRFTRYTNAYSKSWVRHSHTLALYFHYYNFIRPHMTLDTTPAVAAGLAATPQTFAEWVDVIDAARPKPNRPARYRRRHPPDPPAPVMPNLFDTP